MPFSTIQSLPSRQSHLRPGSPLNGVLEGRERVAGGATTGSYGVPSVLSRRAPAGAREACGGSQSGPHSPLCGAPSANGHSLTTLSLPAEDYDARMANGNAPAFDAPHRGLPSARFARCGPHFSRPSRALPSSTMGDRVDPVVSPPANVSRASSTHAGADQFIGINNMISDQFPDVRKLIVHDQAGYAVNHFPDINKMVFTPSSSTPQPR